MKKVVAWRYVSVIIVIAMLGLFAGNLGKPLLTAFVINEGDYNAQVDPAVNQIIGAEGEARVAVIVKEETGIKGWVMGDAGDLANALGTEKVKYNKGNVISADINSEDLEILQNTPSVKEIKKVKPVGLFIYDSVNITNATEVWNYQVNETNITGEGQTICIIDTGVNFNHPALTHAKIIENIDCINVDCEENASVTDDHGHGTIVAGIASANGPVSEGSNNTIRGIAPEAKIIGIKVLDSQGGGYEDDLKLGMEWCVTNAEAYNISVISMSLGTSELYSDYCDEVEDVFNITSTVNEATEKNITVVSATGNQGNNTAIASPACIENSVAVGAVDKSDNLAYNRNSVTDLLAPGVAILSTTKSGSVSSTSGTSMSTPEVAGAIALLQQYYQLTNNMRAITSTIVEALKNTGKEITDTTGTIINRIKIYSALMSLAGVDEGSNETENNETTEEIIIDKTTVTSSLIAPANKTYLKENSNKTLELSCETITITNNSVEANNETNITEYSNNIMSMTLRIWDENETIIINEEKNLTINDTEIISTENDTIITKTYTAEYTETLTFGNTSEEYKWNCLAKASDNRTYEAEKNSIRYDIENPIAVQVSPEDSATTTNNLVRFFYGATDNYEANNCSLTKKGVLIGNKGINEDNNSNYFIYTLENGQYTWSITCYDKAGNSNSTSTRSLTINGILEAQPEPSNTSTGSGGSGGSGGSPGESGTTEEEEVPRQVAAYTATDNEMESGYNIVLGASDELSFKIYKGGTGKEVLLTMYALGTHTARMTLEGSKGKGTYTMTEGENKNFSLEYSNDDLWVLLNDINAGKADMTLRVLQTEKGTSETSPTTGKVVEEVNQANEGQNGQEVNSEGQNISGAAVGGSSTGYIIAIIIVLGVVLGYFIIRRMRKDVKGLGIIGTGKKKEVVNGKAKDQLDKILDKIDKK